MTDKTFNDLFLHNLNWTGLFITSLRDKKFILICDDVDFNGSFLVNGFKV